jgi:hypothetical protein
VCAEAPRRAGDEPRPASSHPHRHSLRERR